MPGFPPIFFRSTNNAVLMRPSHYADDSIEPLVLQSAGRIITLGKQRCHVGSLSSMSTYRAIYLSQNLFFCAIVTLTLFVVRWLLSPLPLLLAAPAILSALWKTVLWIDVVFDVYPSTLLWHSSVKRS